MPDKPTCLQCGKASVKYPQAEPPLLATPLFCSRACQLQFAIDATDGAEWCAKHARWYWPGGETWEKSETCYECDEEQPDA